MAEPKIRRIQTQSGKVFEGPDAEQKFRSYLDSLGAGVGGMELSPVIDAYKNRGDITNIEYEPTQPPPTGTAPAAGATKRQSGLDLPGAIIDRAKQLGQEYIQGPIEAVVGSPYQAASNFVTAAGAKALGFPGRVATLAGFDPSKIKVPYAPSAETVGSAMFPGLGFALTQYEPIVRSLAKREMPPAKLFFQKDVSLKDASKPPKGPGSMAGELFTDAAELWLTRGATGAAAGVLGKGAMSLGTASKSPAIIQQAMPYLKQAYETGATTVKGNRFLNYLANTVADSTLGAIQEFSNAGDADKAIDAAAWGFGTDLLLRGIGGTLTGASKLFAATSLPLIEKLGEKGKQIYDYHQELIDELLKKNIRFTYKGAVKLSDEANAATAAMRNASSTADDVVDDMGAHIPNVLPPGSKDYFVDVDSEFGRAINKMRVKYSGDPKREEIDKVVDKILQELKNIPVLDNQGNKVIGPSGQPVTEDLSNLFYSFKDAERLKTIFNDQLRTYINTPGTGNFENVSKEVKEDLLESVRSAIRKAFDNLKSIKEQNINNLPAGSKSREMSPWDISIPGEKKNLNYAEAGQIARKSVDLATVAWDAVNAMTPQSKRSFFNQDSGMIAASQAFAGSFGTPSQLATTVRVLQAPKWAPSLARGLAKVSTPIGSRTPMAPKRAIASSLARQSEEEQTEPPPVTPEMERLIGEQKVEVVPEPAPAQKKSYWNKTF